MPGMLPPLSDPPAVGVAAAVAVDLATALLAVGLATALLAVDLVSWRRTRPMRRGTPLAAPPGMERGPGPPRTAPADGGCTSLATTLAAAVGAATALAGGSLAPGRPLRAALAAAGAFVAAAGVVWRVTRIEWDERHLRVGYAGRGPRIVAWGQLTALRPPRSPLGGWRLETGREGRHAGPVLMASDLLGHEAVLAAAILHAGLRFDGRSWSRPNAGAGGRRTRVRGLA